MSSEVEVLEGSVSKKAVFSGQVGGNDVRVVPRSFASLRERITLERCEAGKGNSSHYLT